MTLTQDHLSGLYTAIVTPLTQDGAVDIKGLQALVRFQLAAGAQGIVPIGGTGEYPAFSRSERRDIVAACVEAADGKPVIPGVLSTGFEDALEAGRDFAAAGAAAVMTVTPYYAPGTQEGMRAYFRRYRDALDLPVMLYQIPRRTTVAAFADTVQAMAEDRSIIGMKYSSYDMPDFIRTVKYAGDKIAILSGEEPLFATHIALGAKGGVLASATIYPKIWIEIFELAREGKLKEALKLQDKIDPVTDAIYIETNPGPLKTYMELAGMPVGGVRLPLLGPSPETLAKLKVAAQGAKAVNLA
ncbi:4-hydroxy-tetrahydrodipicolinate synthase [Bosea sp. BE125]|uniref:4-hydroxy-tetrahydrodipicolinate synthase n=1 Tax=unclassified Bosea (in: a-proteobacteria) TaxID=2653178 RepID=UPI0028570B2A|nr:MULTISPECIES: 4-hydroxy-tetrahydrodipicolinate synthase [unclassified Bosea (in: a-proteobacteria)]MDR6870795.1 4-hydroxy-tetrahydrodipicolinate synthase [Bosea sp. BE125]WNJ93810.1 4-hydroxy-tetrahydrodipicolinate synthase [Bosea sp. 685]